MLHKRENWLDIAKGLGIIAVVVGHSGNEIAHHFIFWFHMPLFFIISGYLYNGKDNKEELKSWTIKRFYALLIPYASFAALISMLTLTFNFSVIEFIKQLTKTLYGGEFLVGDFGVFWFITCLFLTQIVFSFIEFHIKNKKIQLSIIISFYFLAHLIAEIPVLKNLKTPWNFDIVFIAIVYYAIGFYGKKYLKNIILKKYTLLLSAFLAFIVVVIELITVSNLYIDLKINLYSPIILDIIVPLIFSVLIFSLSYSISKLDNYTFLENIGKASLTIMYLHIPINNFIKTFVGDYSFVTFSLIGIVIPLVIHYLLLVRFNFTKSLFLGYLSNKKTILN